jgi:amino acid transporter
MGVMVAACVLAVTMSLIKGPRYRKPKEMIRPETPGLIGSARVFGITAFVLACIPIISFAVLFYSSSFLKLEASFDFFAMPLMYFTIAVAVVALFACHFMMERFDKDPSRPSAWVRWGGIISIVDLSACLVIILISLSNRVAVDKAPVRHGDHLSGVSYIILGVVFALTVIGLGGCFWKAIQSASKSEPEQEQAGEDINS